MNRTAYAELEAPLAGLAGHAGVDETEALMVHLAVGARLDRAGSIAREQLATGGKRVRARLALAAGEALGLDRDAMVPWAAACELVHAATLVHDDLEDGDRVRRGHPTAWARHGVAQAINTGDLLLMLPFLALERLDTSDLVRFRLAMTLAKRAEQTARGQALDLELLATGRLDALHWSRAAEGKSGALLALPVEGAVWLAGLAGRTAAEASAAFCRIGVLYQLRDDVADAFGDKGRGVPGNDLREGKVSALVVAHARLHPEEVDALVAVLETPRDQTTDVDVAHWLRRFRDGGALSAAHARIAALEDEILSSPMLCAMPDLRAVAESLVTSMRRSS